MKPIVPIIASGLIGLGAIGVTTASTQVTTREVGNDD